MDSKLDDLLLVWEDAQLRGQALSVENLCATCPELSEPLRQRIGIIKAITPVLDLTPFREEDQGEPEPLEKILGSLPGYELLEEVGRGGTAVVYKARQVGLNRLVALKMILAGPYAGEVALARFQKEARTVAQLRHPHIVEIYDLGSHQGCPYFVLEFMESGNLANFLGGRIPPFKQTAALVEMLARTIHFAHLQGVIHRDLKPANVLLKEAHVSQESAIDLGTPKIADFGLARQMTEHKKLTRTGAIMGTPGYMAPEQAEGKQELVGPATDIYSLGVILYQLLTGTLPFTAQTDWELLKKVIQEPPEPLRSRNKECPPALEQVCLRCMEKKPGNRYPSAAALADDLQKFQLGEPISPNGRRSRRRFVAGTAGAALAGASLWLATPLFKAKGNLPPLKVGLLFSLSGPMAINNEPVVDVLHLAIQELNEGGGLLGRPIQAVVANGLADDEAFPREAERLIAEEKVCTLFGCWSSVSRKIVVPVVTNHNNLLLYPVEFEGLERSDHVVYLGAIPNQFLEPALRWAHHDLNRRRFFLIGSEGIFSEAVTAIFKDFLASFPGAALVGEARISLKGADFSKMVDQMRAAQADVVFNLIRGDDNIAFFRALHTAKISPKNLPTFSVDFTEQELRSLNQKDMAGNYLVSSYFQSLNNPENKRFLDRLHSRFGAHRVVSDSMEAAYVGMHLWAQAVRASGSDQSAAIREALVRQRYMGPAGPIHFNSENGYAFKFARIGRIEADGSQRIVWSSPEPLAPIPYPAGRTPEEWTQLLLNYYQRWGNRWSPISP